MKNTLKIDFAKKQLIMDRTFALNCQNTMSEEYAHLQSVRRDYPNYTVVMRKIKTNPRKETYNGLTYDYMREYIRTHTEPTSIFSELDEFDALIFNSECHSKGRRYPTIKKWFLEKYPEVYDFGRKDDETKTKSNDLVIINSESSESKTA